jgi:23S rRNA pseudouridine955/2504/2580 synthase
MAGNETLTVDRDEAGMRLDRWFKAHYPDLSFGHLQKLLRSGQVRVDGGRVKTNTRLEEGQAVRVPPLVAPTPASPGKAAESGGPRQAGPALPRETRAGEGKSPDADFLRSILLYEDDDVFVFNKPAGLAVQGGSGLTKHVDGMLTALTDRRGQKPRLVHRLDRETSGVLIVARTRLAASALAASFRRRSTRKVYWALVKGVPRPHQGRISTFLAREEEHEKMRIAHHGEDEASHAVSLYSTVDHAGQSLAWLSMRPVTGRTHQLRAHAAHIGHPIIGDPKYFNVENWEPPGGLQNRLHLLARRIVIPHPDGGVLDVSAPLPPHMQQSWAVLGFDERSGEDAAASL